MKKMLVIVVIVLVAQTLVQQDTFHYGDAEFILFEETKK